MIEISRSLIRQILPPFKRALGVRGKRQSQATVMFNASSTGLDLRAIAPDTAIEYHLAGAFEPTVFALPLALLAEVEARTSDLVRFEIVAPGKILISWNDGGVPRQREINDAQSAVSFPQRPATSIANEPGLLTALRDAAETADVESSRYALGCLQLQGQHGRIVATDGRQMLAQAGFLFLWTDALLVPAATLFGCRELAGETPINVGLAGEWVTLGMGPWTVWLKIQREGRFPKIDELIRPSASAQSTLSLAAVDAQFLTHMLPRLPSNEGADRPITLDLNGQVLIRGSAADDARPVELALVNSRLTGEPVTLNTNREFLARAIRLGFQEISLFGPRSPALCDDGRRQYVWALLEPDGAIRPCDGATRIESHEQSAPEPASRAKPLRRQLTITPSSEKSTANKMVATAQPPANHECSSAIEQSVALRTALRHSLSQTNELIRLLKREKRQSRLVASTLASLKQLQRVAG